MIFSAILNAIVNWIFVLFYRCPLFLINIPSSTFSFSWFEFYHQRHNSIVNLSLIFSLMNSITVCIFFRSLFRKLSVSCFREFCGSLVDLRPHPDNLCKVHRTKKISINQHNKTSNIHTTTSMSTYSHWLPLDCLSLDPLTTTPTYFSTFHRQSSCHPLKRQTSQSTTWSNKTNKFFWSSPTMTVTPNVRGANISMYALISFPLKILNHFSPIAVHSTDKIVTNNNKCRGILGNIIHIP